MPILFFTITREMYARCGILGKKNKKATKIYAITDFQYILAIFHLLMKVSADLEWTFSHNYMSGMLYSQSSFLPEVI